MTVLLLITNNCTDFGCYSKHTTTSLLLIMSTMECIADFPLLLHGSVLYCFHDFGVVGCHLGCFQH